MFVICDGVDVVQDIATEKANLSRGYNYPGCKLYLDVNVEDIRLGDVFKDNVLTKNQSLRQEQILRQEQEGKIGKMQRKLAIKQLKIDGELPSDFPEK